MQRAIGPQLPPSWHVLLLTTDLANVCEESILVVGGLTHLSSASCSI